MGLDGKGNYFARIKAVHALGRTLAQDEIAALYGLLYRRRGEDSLPLEQLNAVKNDVVTVLREQTAAPPDLARHLMAMFYDEGSDPIWRDYTVQHLGEWYRKEPGGAEKTAIRDLFWHAAEETGSSIAGTALIALANNANQSGIDGREVAAKALVLSEDDGCGELAKITALQICARFGETRVLSVARRLAESSASATLRMSAITVVGTLGSASDRPLLEKYAADSDGRLRTAAQSALGRLGKARAQDPVPPPE